MTLSVIIVNFNTKNFLRNCLTSILQTTKGLGFETIVVDNASSDLSQEMVKKEFPQVKLIKNKQNLGFARANNQGAKKAKGEYLFFLNSDTIILNKALLKLVKFAEENPKVGLLAPKLVLENDSPQPIAFGEEPSLWQITFGRFFKPKKIDWLSGAAILTKRELFEKIGGFDENFFMYFEDIDLSKRVKKAGFEIRICKKAKVIHLLGQSIRENRLRKMFYYQSQSYFYKKHYGFLAYLVLVIFRFPLKLWKTLK